MTANKRRWLSKIHHDSEEFQATYANISWSNSESESEPDNDLIVKGVKRLKQTENISNSTDKWTDIKRLISETISTKQKLEEKPLNVVQNAVCKQTCDNTSLLYTSSYEESPVISKVSLNSNSPVLTSSSTSTNSSKDGSPIIGNRSRLKKIVVKRKQLSDRQSINCSNRSPDLFESQSTQLIEHDSPLEQASRETTRISPVIDLSSKIFSPTRYIDTFSQNTSVVVNYASVSENSLKTTSSESLYHMPPKKKRRYKKGGLAFLLQKTLSLQKNKLSIWRHEVYLKKKDILLHEESWIRFQVNRFKREYGSAVLECNICSDSISENANSSQVLIVIGPVVGCNFTAGFTYILFPPYECKNILHNSRQVQCYFKVSRILQTTELT